MPALRQAGYRLFWQGSLPPWADDLPRPDDAGRFFEAIWQQLHMDRHAENAVLLNDAVFGKAIRIRERSLRWWRRVKRIEREFRALSKLQALGVPVPRPILCATARSQGVVSRAFLLEAALPGWRNLAELLEEQALAARDRPGLFAAVGRLVGSLHGQGYAHRDLSCRNVMVRCDSEEGVCQTSLIDCPRAERIWLPLRRRHLRGYDLYRIARSGRRLGASDDELICLLECAGAPKAESILAVLDKPANSWPVQRLLWLGG